MMVCFGVWCHRGCVVWHESIASALDPWPTLTHRPEAGSVVRAQYQYLIIPLGQIKQTKKGVIILNLFE